VVCAIVVVVLVASLVIFPPLDGYSGWFISLLASVEDTVYAPGYSDGAFRRLRIGMSEQEVAGLLGEPLEKYDTDPDLHGGFLRGWKYARSANDQSYRVRCVRFREGRVADVISEFYLD
jgi:hypothetical protein